VHCFGGEAVGAFLCILTMAVVGRRRQGDEDKLLGRCWKTVFRFSVDETCYRGCNSVVLLRQRNFVGLMKCLGYDSSLWKAGQTGF
jgi:hypothetical protein